MAHRKVPEGVEAGDIVVGQRLRERAGEDVLVLVDKGPVDRGLVEYVDGYPLSLVGLDVYLVRHLGDEEIVVFAPHIFFGVVAFDEIVELAVLLVAQADKKQYRVGVGYLLEYPFREGVVVLHPREGCPLKEMAEEPEKDFLRPPRRIRPACLDKEECVGECVAFNEQVLVGDFSLEVGCELQLLFPLVSPEEEKAVQDFLVAQVVQRKRRAEHVFR